MTSRSRYRIATDVAHLGRDPRRFLGAVNTPVFRASTILFRTVAELEQAARGEFPDIAYGLHGLPTVGDLARALAALEGGHAALIGTCRHDVSAACARETRRPRAGDRRRLRADTAFL